MAILPVGPDKLYTTIISAYNEAADGDTLWIDEGVYDEHIIMEYKVVNLVGNTDYPAEGKVELTSNNYFGVLDIVYNGSNPILIDKVKIRTTRTDAYSAVRFRAGDGSPTFDTIFSQCILDSSSSSRGSFFSNSVHSIESLVIQNCDCYLFEGNLGASYFYSIDNRQMIKCRVDASSVAVGVTAFGSGDSDYISTSKKFHGYGAKYGTSLVVINPPLYEFTGNIRQDDLLVNRELRIFRQDNDVFLGAVTSSDGAYEIGTSFGGPHYMICLDDSISPYYNDLLKSDCYPVESGDAISHAFINKKFSLANPGAEQRSLVGWEKEEGSISTYSEGYNSAYKFGRAVNAPGTHIMTQQIDLIAQGVTASGIDSELYSFVTTLQKQSGSMYIGSRLLDENRVVIGSDNYVVQAASASSWTESYYRRTLTSGTRYVDLLCKAYHPDWSRVTYFDDVETFIRIPSTSYEELDKLKYIELINSSADYNSLAGWTNEGDQNFGIASAASHGSVFFSDYINADYILSQRVDLLLGGISGSDIDQGKATFHFKAEYKTYSASAYLGIRSVNNPLTVSGTVWYTLPTEVYWTYDEFDTTLVSGTRYVDVILKSHNFDHKEVWFDGVIPWVTISG